MTDLDITYAAHTANCTFLLDADGICRRIVVVPSKSGQARGRDAARTVAARCVGAQYVASLDPSVTGMLADMPRVGSSMLFARTDERGRISLVRTGLVTQFERQRHDEDPFDDDRSSSVVSSAPPMTPSLVPTPRRARETSLPPPDLEAATHELPAAEDDLDATTAYTKPKRVPTRPSPGYADAAPPTVRTPQAFHGEQIPRTKSDVVPKNPLVGPPRVAIRKRAI